MVMVRRMALTIVDRPHGTDDRHAVYKVASVRADANRAACALRSTTTTLMVWRSHCLRGRAVRNAPPSEIVRAGGNDEHRLASIIVCDPLVFCRWVGFVGDH